MNFKRTKSFLYMFEVDGKVYYHHIFSHEDDRVECTDEDGNVVLTYTADCYAFDGTKKDGKRIGHWSMVSTDDYRWYFKTNTGVMHRYGGDVLRAEVEVSKLYLTGQLK